MSKRQPDLFSFFSSTHVKKARNNDRLDQDGLEIEQNLQESNDFESSFDITGQTGTSEPPSPASPAPSMASSTPSSSLSASSVLDIGLYLNEHISDAMRLDLLLKPWTPDKSYRFPVAAEGTGKNQRIRKFQLAYLEKFPFLSYSHEKNGAFCRICVLFVTNKVKTGRLVQEPMQKYKDFGADCLKHQENQYHKDAVERAKAFEETMKCSSADIVTKVARHGEETRKRNREIIKSIIETISLCGTANLPLRGHRDHGLVMNSEVPTTNDGVMRKLLRYRAAGGDVLLLEHLQSAAKNAMYTSPRIQNEMIGIFKKTIQGKIVGVGAVLHPPFIIHPILKHQMNGLGMGSVLQINR